jgi:hypothetical protein
MCNYSLILPFLLNPWLLSFHNSLLVNIRKIISGHPKIGGTGVSLTVAIIMYENKCNTLKVKPT